MLYDISLKITYSYEIPVSGGRHMVRVLPLSLPSRQRLVAGNDGVGNGSGARQGPQRQQRACEQAGRRGCGLRSGGTL